MLVNIKDYKALQSLASSLDRSVEEVAGIAVRLLVYVVSGSVVSSRTPPPDLEPIPNMSDEERLALEKQWIRDNGMLTILEVAEVLSRHTSMVKKYINRGWLEARYWSSRGWRYFDPADLEGLVHHLRSVRSISEKEYARLLTRVHQVLVIQEARRMLARTRRRSNA